MKLNWFSPLPPARSAVAAYAAAVLPELRRHAEVTVWEESLSPVATSGNGGEREGAPSGIAPATRGRHLYHPQTPPWDEINRADLSIYHLGNHALFHGAIWELSRRHPGVVVLHDARLQEFVAGCATLRRDRAGYLALMRRYHGARGAAAAADIWDGLVPASELVEPFPLTAPFVDRALGVVVHGAEALDLVAPHAAGPILCTHLPYAPTRDALVTRQWQPPFQLILFGFLGGERGIDAALAALAALPQRSMFHLDVYGELPDAERWRAQAGAAGLQDSVTLHGFVPDAVLAAALDRAHLALNLRFPSRGEASYSLLHAWDHALPVVVNRIGAFTEIPEACVAFARPEAVRDDLIRHLQTLLADPHAYRRIGEAGRARLLRHHSPAIYAEHLVRFATVAAQGGSRPGALQMADRAAAALRDVAGSHVDDWAVRRIGSAVYRIAGGRAC